MRYKILFSALAIGWITTASGCKIVTNPDPNAASETEANQTDEMRMGHYAREIWTSQVLPAVTQHIVPLTDLRAAHSTDEAAAGQAYGMRPEGESNPWNFAVRGTGVIVEANLKSRAAKLQIDTDADGTADITVQLGPIIRGTALRDAMPFIIFTDFRDQIEFAKLARGLNAMAFEGLALPDPDTDIVGQTVTFEGVFTYQNATSKPEIVPTALTFGGPE
jgi:predicted lipoprotein